MTPTVLFNSVLTVDNVSITGHTPPHDIEGALSSLTFDYWGFSGNQTLDVTEAATGIVNALGIYGDGLAGVEVLVSYSGDGIEYENIVTDIITQDGASLFVFPLDLAVNFYRISFVCGSDSDVKIRAMFLGQRLEFERCLMGSFEPPTYNRVSHLISGGSGQGQHLSKKFIYQGFETNVSFSMITSAWGRVQFQGFVQHALRAAYFFSWNPDKYPSEAIYGWTDEDIPLGYTGDANLMQSSWTVKR
jgi:hypothetical protein